MTAKMFDKLNALVLILLPEFQMTINTGSYDKICPETLTDYTINIM